MAMNRSQVAQLLEAQNISYQCPSDQETVILTRFNNMNAKIGVIFFCTGDSIKVRTHNLMICQPDDPHFEHVLHLINDINRELRFVKLSVDLSDGEVIGEADIWLEDQELSSAQLRTCLANFILGLDTIYPRLQRVINRKEPWDQWNFEESAQELQRKWLLKLMEHMVGEPIH